MRINILSYEPANGWILFDYAKKLSNAISVHIENVTLSHEQLPGFDVTFHVNYAGLQQILVPGIHCTMVTHIDSPEKFELVRAQAKANIYGMCMSEETSRRLNSLVGTQNFTNFSPPSMLQIERRKRLNFLIAGRLYPDGRKNEIWAINFFKLFEPSELVIRIIGEGWDEYITSLIEQGFLVEYSPTFDKLKYHEFLEASDYLVVTGHDEGALSTLDALLFECTPICTAQGYHLEQSGDIILYQTYEELSTIGKKLRAQLSDHNNRLEKLINWDFFARKHIDYWSSKINLKSS